jgi:hypothetical protein
LVSQEISVPDDAAPAGARRPTVAAGSSVVAAPDHDVPASPPAPAAAALPFPADTRTLSFPTAEFVAAGQKQLRFRLVNEHSSGVLHARLRAPAGGTAAWLDVTPAEAALGPGETQTVIVRVDLARARAAVARDEPTTMPLEIVYQRLFTSDGNGGAPAATGTVYVRLPAVVCPVCNRPLGEALLGQEAAVPDVCPFCFERLRPCPICGTPNSWLAERCVLDGVHVVRAAVAWTQLGGGPDHAGSRTERVLPTLARRWSFPSVPPARAEAALAWSAPVAAYGLVAAAAATSQGDAHLYAFDAATGALLWDPYPLPDPCIPSAAAWRLPAVICTPPLSRAWSFAWTRCAVPAFGKRRWPGRAANPCACMAPLCRPRRTGPRLCSLRRPPRPGPASCSPATAPRASRYGRAACRPVGYGAGRVGPNRVRS